MLFPQVQQIDTPDPLARWKAAAANAANVPVNILAMGNSLEEGYDPDSSHLNFIDDRWLTRFMALTRTRYGVAAGGLGTVNTANNCVNGSNAGSGYWTFSGGGSSTTSDLRAFAHDTYLPAVNEVLTFHINPATSVLFQLELGSSPVTIAVDGGAPVTVTPGAGTAYQGAYQAPILTSGAHSYEIHPTSSQRAKVHVAQVFNGDESSGFRLWDNSQSNQSGLLESTYVPTDQLSANFCVSPALVLLCFGTNDFGLHIAVPDFVAALHTIIATVNGLCTIAPSWALIAPHERGDIVGSPSPSWAQYIAGYRRVTSAWFYDVSAAMAKPTVGNGYSGGKVNTDLVHLTSVGNQFYAAQIDAALAA